LDDDPTYRERAKHANIKSIRYVADVIDIESDKISYFDVTVSDDSSITRSRVAIQHLLRSIVETHSHLLITFHYEDTENRAWRFSYAYKENTIGNMATAKRFTYIFGKEYKSRTAVERFVVLSDSRKSDDDFAIAFSVEKLSDEFFVGYKQRYQKFCDYLLTEPSMIESFKYFNQDGSGKFIRDYVKKMFGRIVFLYFIQRKGWLNNNRNYMMELFQKASDDIKDDYLDRVLEPLFFGILNTDKPQRKALFEAKHWDMSLITGCDNIAYLNGGLFEEEEVDDAKSVFPREYFSDLFTFLSQYNFTIDENDTEDAEIGIDPEMLGRIFENLLEDNKDKGAFYTPKEIVNYMCREAIIAYLQDPQFKADGNALIRQFVETFDRNLLSLEQRRYIKDKLKDIKICDPAIGSGAFPMGLVNLLSKIYSALRLSTEAAEIKRHIMEKSIYGVDIEKGAVDIARLRFWLAMIVEEPEPTPLPNLHFKIMHGNSLVEQCQGVDLSDLTTVKAQKTLFDSDDVERESLRANLKKYYGTTDHAEREQRFTSIIRNVRRQIYAKNPEIDQSDLDPSETDKFFLWHTWFADIFDKGGFDIVIGNPPYIQLQKATGRKAYDKKDKEYDEKLGDLYVDCGFETFEKTGDIYCLFYEKGMSLLKPQGILCYITSNKWMRAGYGESIRGFFAKKTNPIKLIDLSGVKIFDNATVDVNILFLKNEANAKSTLACKIDSADSVKNLSDFVQQQANKCSFETSDSWVILSPIEQSIKHKIESVGTPLKDWDIQINYGIKTGFNDAFIIKKEVREEILNNCQTEDERKRTDELIRPILRGRDIKRYAYDWAELYLVYIPWHFPYQFDDSITGASEKAEQAFSEQYPAVYNHLLQYKDQLSKRNKAETGIRYEWYALQRWGAKYWEDFSKPKIVWARLMRIAKSDMDSFPRFAAVKAGMFVVDSLCFFGGKDIETICTMLNSTYAAYYFLQNIAILDNGGMQMRQQYVEEIPLPKIKMHTESDLYNAFGLTKSEIEHIESFVLQRKIEIANS
jgi:type I restriction-modification system DNA methylase subunit